MIQTSKSKTIKIRVNIKKMKIEFKNCSTSSLSKGTRNEPMHTFRMKMVSKKEVRKDVEFFRWSENYVWIMAECIRSLTQSCLMLMFYNVKC